MTSSGPVLTAWRGGPRAREAGANAQEALDSLARILDMKRARLVDELEAFYVHDWSADPYARGAYSYVRAGGLEAADRLAEPVEDTLYFAGEHTAAGAWGTVHGAIASGIRAARQIAA